ncbi:MAG TPA: glycosyltransferase family 1 protein [Firmicutes bacterium]|nr:glycosyltransferase family 1 protein [Bacillota bacterium]
MEFNQRLFISTHNPVINGGALQMMKFIGEEMSSVGFKPYFYFPSHSLTDFFRFKVECDKVLRFPARRYFSCPFFEFIKFLFPSFYMTRKEAPGIYHGLGGTALTGLPFYLNSNKYVIWAATTFKTEFRTQLEIFKHFQIYYLMNMLLYPLNRFFEGLVIKGAGKVIALSEYTKRNICNEFKIPKEFVSVINIPVDTNFFSYRERKGFSFPRRIKLLNVGRIDDPRKNIPFLLKAVKTLVSDGFDIELTLAGACKARKLFYLKEFIHEIEDRVNILIYPEQNTIRDLYRESDLFVLTSKQEGLGIVLLEAMSSGLPVVSTRCGGPEDIIDSGKNGYLAECNDLIDYTDKIKNLLTSESLYAQFSFQGRETVERRFSKEVLRDNMIEIYREVFPEQFK